MALVALGVTGGIGAYKAVEVARGLQQRGHDVVAVMTRGAQNFVGPLTFEAITRRPVITDQWAPGVNAHIEHIALASSIQLLLVAPATAHVIGRMANGLADDFLTSLYLATRAPVLVAPAMNANMLEHEAVKANLDRLAARGVEIVAPGEGYLACGWIGKGRLAEPDDVVDAAEAILSGRRKTMEDVRVVVSAGPTYEDFDPVRYVGNRSSGRMGIAIATEARKRGARVTLVLGPTSVVVPTEVDVVHVRSAADMHAAMMAHAPQAEIIVMAAAVADYTFEGGPAAQKLPKERHTLQLQLVRTKDILAELGRWRADRPLPVIVGFAAETHDVVARALAKRAAKRADVIVANDVSRHDAGFEVDTNAATLITEDGAEDVPLMSKSALAATLLDRVETLLAERRSAIPS
ncbi:MAG: bifunctional phosphopantothenoylcysteine decarboxylase/phosphopantothenate--cysteine ligase CoaBC [Vicinamibacterales bacterium]